MYFENINDSELIQFHNKFCVNFREDFTGILTGCFHKDSIHVDGGSTDSDLIVRFQPLFYCDEINVNDSSVNVLDNKCVIGKFDEDTIFNFNSVDRFNSIDDLCLMIGNSGDEFTVIVYNSINLSTVADVNVRVVNYDSLNFNHPSFKSVNFDVLESFNTVNSSVDVLNQDLIIDDLSLVSNKDGIVTFSVTDINSLFLELNYKDKSRVVKLV